MKLDGLTQWLVDNFSNIFSKEFIVFLTSMIPFIELKGGLLAASIMEIKVWIAIPACLIANILPMPIALFVFKKFLSWIKDKPGAKWIMTKINHWVEKRRDKIDKYAYWGIILTVINPIPGTGGYSCSLLAACLNMDYKKALRAIVVGLFFSSFLMAGIYYGFIEIFL